MERKVNRRRRIVLASLLAAGAMSLGIVGCSRSTQESVGPGVIFNNVIAGDMGGALKVVFPEYNRAPAVEQERGEHENFLIEVHPVWSPDGEKLAFTRTIGEEGEALFVRTSLGHPEAEAKEIGAAIGRPVWSPTSDMVAYLAMSGGAKEGEGGGEKAAEATEQSEGEAKEGGEEKPVGLTIVGPDGENSRLIAGGEAEPVAWSEEGIYYTSGVYGMRDLRVIDPANKKSKVIYEGSGGKFVGEAALAPDGDSMAIEVVSPNQNSVLVVKDVRTGRLTQATGVGRVTDIAWAPNGKTVVFVWLPGPERPGEVMAYSIGASKPVAVTRRAGKYRSPSFAADSQTVAFVLAGDIYVQKVGTGTAKRVTKTGDAADIAWSPK